MVNILNIRQKIKNRERINILMHKKDIFLTLSSFFIKNGYTWMGFDPKPYLGAKDLVIHIRDNDECPKWITFSNAVFDFDVDIEINEENIDFLIYNIFVPDYSPKNIVRTL